MNANENSPKTNLRLKRIQKVSENLKTFFLLACCGCFALGMKPILLDMKPLVLSMTGQEFHTSAGLMSQVIIYTWALEYLLAYKLFSAFSRGDLFSVEIIRWFRWIGCVGILLGIEINVTSFIAAMISAPWWACLGAAPFLVFSVIPGFAILCIAWIMDEGRKIQEEQELTV
jgi:hypothetical protein